MIDIKPWPQNKNYLVLTDGRIYSTYTSKFLTQDQQTNGYLKVSMKESPIGAVKNFLVHRVVAETYLDNPLSKPQVNHKDENKTNNNVENLEWMTPKENINHGTCLKRSSISQGTKVIMCDSKTHVPQMIFITVSAAFRYLNSPVSGHIAAVCNGTRNSFKKHWWRYWTQDDDNLNLPIYNDYN